MKETFTPQQIEEYRAILDDFKRKEENTVSLSRTCVNPSCKQNGPLFLSNLVFIFARNVIHVTAKLLVITIRKSMIDFIIEKRVFTRESITMKTK